MDATGWVNFLQVGFTAENTWLFRISGYDTTENRYFVSLRLSPDSDSADVINFQMQQRYGTASQSQTYYYPGITRTLTEGNWYKLTGEFKSANAGTQITVRGSFEDWGLSGTGPVSTLWTYPEWTFPMPNPIASDDTVWAGFRAVNQSGAAAVDNFSASGPASPPPPPRTHVLCIGMQDDLHDIRCDIEAQRVRDLLAQSFRSVKTAQFLPLTMNNTIFNNRDAVMSMIDAMRSSVRGGDTFVFFIATHGRFDLLGDEAPVNVKDLKTLGGLIPSTGDERFVLSGIDGNQTISDDEFRGMFSDPLWDQVHKLFLIDSCYSGGFMGSTAYGDTGDLTTLPRTALIAASPEWEPASTQWDDSIGAYVGIFGTAVLKALDQLKDRETVDFYDLVSLIDQEGKVFDGSNGRILDYFEDTWDLELPALFTLASSASTDFELTLGVPEPGTFALLAVSALCLLWRNRHTRVRHNANKSTVR